MRRRTFLASTSAFAVMNVAGCVLSEDSSPTFILHDIRSYQPDAETIFVLSTVERQGEGDGEVTIDVELLFENMHNWGMERTFKVREKENEEQTLAHAFTADSPTFDQPFTAKAKIIRQDDADSDWVEETD